MRYVSACEHGLWHLLLDHELEGGEIESRTHKYSCRSWRHAGKCRMWRGAQDFQRISDGLDARDAWIACVLTFHRATKPQDWDQYRESYHCWSALRLRLRRLHGHIDYVQTWECTRRGTLHLNVALHWKGLAKQMFTKTYTLERRGKPHLVSAAVLQWRRKELGPLAVGCGFGKVCWAELVRPGTSRAYSAYLTKRAAELVGAGKEYQIPVDAPAHFRRLRASRGLLPKPYKSGLTGRLVFLPLPE